MTTHNFKIENIQAAADATAERRVAEALDIARNNDPGEIIASAGALAKLDETGYARVKQALRDRGFGRNEFSIADLNRAVKAKRITQQQLHRVPRDDKRTEVVLGADEGRANREVIAALAHADDGIYHRGGALVRIVTTEDEAAGGVHRSAGSHKIGDMPVANLRERISDHALLIQEDSDGNQREAHPPEWMARGIHARGEWPQLRYLAGIGDAPFLRADGTVCTTPGYDPSSRVYLTPGGVADPIPDKPTLAQAEAARDRLLDLIADFSFEGDEDQQDEYRAAWLAGVLTPFARQAFTGPAPLFLVDANAPGCGKTMLPGIAGRILMGRAMPTAGYAHDATEMSKRITTVAREADQIVLLDNIVGSFGNEALDRALTTTQWKERILGQTAQVDTPLLATWWATANNVEVAADLIRRVLHIRLSVMSDHPEDRTGPDEGRTWKYPNLDGHVAQHYRRYRADALTILAGYCTAGRPVEPVKPFGSFEGWSALVRQAVLWAGCADPCDTRRRLAEASDTKRASLGEMLAAWHNCYPDGGSVTVAELLEVLYPNGKKPEGESTDLDAMKFDQLRLAVEACVPPQTGRLPGATKLGAFLRSQRNRVVDGLAFDYGERTKAGRPWSVVGVHSLGGEDAETIVTKKQPSLAENGGW